jgi:hypothetical protein
VTISLIQDFCKSDKYENIIMNCGYVSVWNRERCEAKVLYPHSPAETEEKFCLPMPPHVPYGLRGLPSRLWPKCNRLLRLARP